MVSLWPWKGEDNSPASFEKALATLAEKIARSQAHLDLLRTRAKRHRVLWTLYSSFTYLLVFVILFLVVGWRNWTALEYTGVAGSPLVIWGIRMGIDTYYTYRIDTASERLSVQQKERTKTIDKLKAATKYDSTQELLEKYGGAPSKPKKDSIPKTPQNLQKQTQGRQSMGGRQSIGPQPQISSQPTTPQSHQLQRTPPSHTIPSPGGILPGQAEFAPNAFSAPPQFAAGEAVVESHWYDRILDVLLGEDEASPKNRVVLICQNCRLVNGQAPAGIKNLAELGKWRCYGCGTMNAVEDEAAKAVKEMKERFGEEASEGSNSPTDDTKSTQRESSGDSNKADSIKHEVVEEGEEDSAEDMVEVKPRRGRSSRKKTS